MNALNVLYRAPILFPLTHYIFPSVSCTLGLRINRMYKLKHECSALIHSVSQPNARTVTHSQFVQNTWEANIGILMRHILKMNVFQFAYYILDIICKIFTNILVKLIHRFNCKLYQNDVWIYMCVRSKVGKQTRQFHHDKCSLIIVL